MNFLSLISYKIRTDKVIREHEEQIEVCNRRLRYLEEQRGRYEADPFEAAWEEFLWEESCRLYPVSLFLQYL